MTDPRDESNEPSAPALERQPKHGRWIAWALVLAGVAIAAPRLQRENFFSAGGEIVDAPPLPEFPTSSLTGSRWIGTDPLTVEDLRGRVWVLKVWTFGCINCVKSIPYANALAERFGDDVGVLGIHSPEFDWERDDDALSAALDEHGVRFPSYVDEGLDYFFALDTPAWPSFYVVDRAGRIRGRWVGEVHAGTLRAGELEGLIERLIAE